VRRSILFPVLGLGCLLATAVGGVALAGAATVPTKTVTITGTACPGQAEFCYKGGTVTVKPGTKVVWKNASVAPHTVTRCDVADCKVNGGTGKDPKLASGTINAGKTYSFTFHKTGTYRYYCKVHGYSLMHGVITVK
jgi:plastocyanin